MTSRLERRAWTASPVSPSGVVFRCTPYAYVVTDEDLPRRCSGCLAEKEGLRQCSVCKLVKYCGRFDLTWLIPHDRRREYAFECLQYVPTARLVGSQAGMPIGGCRQGSGVITCVPVTYSSEWKLRFPFPQPNVPLKTVRLAARWVVFAVCVDLSGC
jgi:hypothetical protein